MTLIDKLYEEYLRQFKEYSKTIDEQNVCALTRNPNSNIRTVVTNIIKDKNHFEGRLINAIANELISYNQFFVTYEVKDISDDTTKT